MNNPNSEVWVGEYHLSNQAHGIALGYADSREHFEAQMTAYCEAQGVRETHQLAPIPMLTRIKRHGMRWDYWYFAQALSPQNPFQFIPIEALEAPKAIQSTTNYLIEDAKPISELGRRFGNFFPLAVPAILNDAKENGFFAQMNWYADYADEAEAPKMDTFDGQAPNYYLVIDAEKSFFFPSDFDDLKHECLYKGKSYENAGDIAPYLVKIKAGDRESREFVQKLFTWHESNVHSHWDINPAIFIRSYHDFNTVFNHLRKFTHLLGTNDAGEEKWYFFRFYDPTVLVPYLKGIAYHPNHLASFFGIKAGNDNQIIDAFGARIDKIFHTFETTPLPEGTVSAKIALGEVERKVFETISQDKHYKNKVIQAIKETFPNKAFGEELIKSWFNKALEQGFDTDGAMIRMVKSEAYLHKSEWNIEDIIENIQVTYGQLSPSDLSKLVYQHTLELIGNHNG